MVELTLPGVLEDAPQDELPDEQEIKLEARSTPLLTYLRDCQEAVSQISPWHTTGRLTRVAGLIMEASGLKLATGASCRWTASRC
jgi:hypothetical protein